MLPFMRSKNKTSMYDIKSFEGINPSYSRKVNEFAAAVNMTSEAFPALKSAPGFGMYSQSELPCCGCGYYDKLYTVRHDDANTGKVYICTDNQSTEIAAFAADGEEAADRTMAFMKDEILIIPDNVIYHTNTGTARQGCVKEITTEESATAKFQSESKTDDEPPSPYNIWYSAYITGNSIVSMSGNYRPSSTSYKFYHFSVSDNFAVGDVITLKMDVKPIDASQDSAYRAYKKKMADGITLKIKDLVTTTHSTPSGTKTEYTSVIFDDNAVDMGGYDEVFVFDVAVEKGIPNFVDICSFENRIWGVTADQICASKLGDSSEWNDFTADAYGTLPSSCFKTEVETDGSFTAIAPYNGSILAFKEDCVHKIYGDQPDEYTVTTMECTGVQSGAAATIATVNGVLYYKGKDGIYALSSGLPQLISQKLNTEGLSAKYACGDDRYYYVEMYDDTQSYIYVYDTLCGIWHMQTMSEKLKGMVNTPVGVRLAGKYGIFGHDTGIGSDWSFELIFGTKEFASKHISQIMARYSLSEESTLDIKLRNKHGIYPLCNARGAAADSILRVKIPVTCSEDAALIFTGKGDFTLSSLTVNFRETNIDN